MTTSSEAAVEIEAVAEIYDLVAHHVSEDIQAKIESRLKGWRKDSATPDVPSTGPAPVLVRRPGIPPQPLDPLYFKLKEEK